MSVRNLIEKATDSNNNERLDMFMYLERYINDGSPSGFKLNMPDEFSPFNPKKNIEIIGFRDDWQNHIQIGSLPEIFQDSTTFNLPFFIHPNIYNQLGVFKDKLKNTFNIKAQPTSSGRTVLISESKSDLFYIKLHYPNKIGRFNRDISLYKWMSIFDKSTDLFNNINSCPNRFSFLHDFGGTFYNSDISGLSFGTVFRSFYPYPFNKHKTLLIPSFSLFAKNNNSKSVLYEIINYYSLNIDLFLDFLIYPLLESYIFLSCNLGLIPEINAQNLLYELDLEKHTSRIVLRDLGDIFVDFSIRNEKNLHTSFCTYKTLDPKKDNDIKQRRSFAFDFKLTSYVILPLIDEFVLCTGYNKSKILKIIKEYVNNNFPNMDSYFDSAVYWYKYPRKDNVSRTSYIKTNNPIIR